MRKQLLKILPFLFLMMTVQNNYAQKERSEIPDKYKWNLADLYKSDEAWKAAKDEIAGQLDKIESFKGTLTQSAQNLLACLEFLSKTRKEAVRLYIYANMNSDLDTRNMTYLGMKQELQQLFTSFSAKAAFVDPEILQADWETIEGFIKEEPKLKDYDMALKDLFRQKEHTLSEDEEKILSLSSLITGSPASIYSTFKNAEMPSPEVTLSNGEKVVLSSAGYEKYRAVSNRDDRQLVFETFWNNYAKYKATFGEMLYGNVKSHMFNVQTRNYESSLEASLYGNAIPTEVYHSLIKNVNKNLPAFHRYLKIKKRMLGVDTLKYLDLYAPVVKDINLEYTYDEAKEIINKALAPLGEEYLATVEKAMNERWIDVYPTPGKRSGAYSNGSGYDVHPYILLNYNDLYSDVSTLAHELGHTMHSYYSNKTQTFPKSNYAIFVAEVASTFNEVLLFDYMKKKVEDPDVRLSLLMNWLDGFKGTLFRQTQFAEFELRIHEIAEKGKPLTGDQLSEIYADIVNSYYGHEEGICHVDDYIHMEWAFIPHFYYNFYVYQYSTSFTASITLAEKVLQGEKGALEKYINFFSSGGSKYPIELLKDAGVDMTDETVFAKAIESMNAIMDEIEKILDEKEGK